MSTEPKDGILRVVSGYTKSIDSKKRSVRAVLSSEAVDRYGDVILVSSWNNKRNFENYFEANNILLWAHARDSAFGNKPIGNVVNCTFDGTDGAGNLSFDGDAIFTDAFQGAEDIWKLYEKGVCKCFSVGFRPITVKKEPVKEGQTGYTFLENELLENSAVPIPANPMAISKAFKDGDLSEEFLVNTFFQLRDHVIRNADILLPTDWHYKDSINELAIMAAEFDQSKLVLPSAFARKHAVLQPVKAKEPTPEPAPTPTPQPVKTDTYNCANCEKDSQIDFKSFPEAEFHGIVFNNVACAHCKMTMADCLEATEILLSKLANK